MDDIKEYLREIGSASAEDILSRLKGAVPKISLTLYEDDLRRARDIFQTRYTFTVGQFVKWKAFMKNRKMPAEGQPAIVMEVLAKPVFDSNTNQSGASTPYFREPLDIALGLIDDDGDFSVYFYDSRRLEPYKTEKLG